MKTFKLSMQKHHARQQAGAALIIGLIFLLLISLLAVTSMSSTVLQERMTGGQRNESLSNAGAESAMRGAEELVWSKFVATDGAGDPTDARIVQTDQHTIANGFRNSRTWVDGTAYGEIDYDGMAAKAGGSRLNRDPHFVIEEIVGAEDAGLESHYQENYGSGSVGDVVYFRTSTRSTGGDPNTLRTLESQYALGR